jgi:hypothetical protein
MNNSTQWEADLDQDENANGSPRTEKSVPVVIAEALALDPIRMGKASEAIEKAIAANSGLNVSDSDIADGLTDEAMEILKAHFVSWWA